MKIGRRHLIACFALPSDPKINFRLFRFAGLDPNEIVIGGQNAGCRFERGQQKCALIVFDVGTMTYKTRFRHDRTDVSVEGYFLWDGSV